jgi:hypothetical protein
MRIKHTLLVTIVAGSLLITNSAYGADKQGSSCKKAGTTSTVNGLKYTCVKSGKKLVWSKGVTVKKASSPKTGVCPPMMAADKDPGITQARADALVTMNEIDAEACAMNLDWLYRVGQRDDEMFAGTRDYRIDRVTVTVMKGLVTLVLVG